MFKLGLDIDGFIGSFGNISFLRKCGRRGGLQDQVSRLMEGCLPKVTGQTIVFVSRLSHYQPRFTMGLLRRTGALFRRSGVVIICSASVSRLTGSLRKVCNPGFSKIGCLRHFCSGYVRLGPVGPTSCLSFGNVGARTKFVFIGAAMRLLSCGGTSLQTYGELTVSVSRLLGCVLGGRGCCKLGRTSQFPGRSLLPTLVILDCFRPLS